jgi:hypothetical protein
MGSRIFVTLSYFVAAGAGEQNWILFRGMTMTGALEGWAFFSYAFLLIFLFFSIATRANLALI